MAQGTDKELDLVIASNSDEKDDREISTIKEQIGDARGEMGQTIDELQERLSVPVLTAQIKEEVAEQFASAIETTKDVIYETTINKLSNIMKSFSKFTSSAGGGVTPWLMIGVGTGLILMNRRSSSSSMKKYRVTNGSRKGRSSIGTATESENANTSVGAFDEVKGAASSAYHQVGDAVSSAADRVGDIAASGKERYAVYFDDNPMAVGAVAAAMGLALGLALPLTEAENELLGKTAGSIRAGLEGAAKETVESITESANDFIDGIGDSDRKDNGPLETKLANKGVEVRTTEN